MLLAAGMATGIAAGATPPRTAKFTGGGHGKPVLGVCAKDTTGSVTVDVAPGGPEGQPGRGEIFMRACVNTTAFPSFMSQLVPMLRSVRFRGHA